jgi:hypothetical protein
VIVTTDRVVRAALRRTFARSRATRAGVAVALLVIAPVASGCSGDLGADGETVGKASGAGGAGTGAGGATTGAGGAITGAGGAATTGAGGAITGAGGAAGAGGQATTTTAGCGDGACAPGEDCHACPQDCGDCPPACPDGACNGAETCASCPDDCGPCPPACPDGACNGAEDCASCPQDCGACLLGLPPGPSPADPACTGGGGEAGTKCGNIADAHVANGVNVGYYPFKIKPGVATHLYTCDDRFIQDLNPGDGFAVQSTRNPSCSDNPPLRPDLAGFVFGYSRGSSKSGWVPASALEWTGYAGGTCADGPASADFEVAHDPYDGCAATVCSGGFHTCAAANGPNDGSGDCGGKTMNVSRTVKSDDMYLRYAPLSTAVRYLHKGDVVKVLYDNLKGWSFVEVTGTTCPVLTPNGSRGWCQTSELQ